jgi:hypothetical protein
MFFDWVSRRRTPAISITSTSGRRRTAGNTRTVDSRDSQFTNKEYIAGLIADYGIGPTPSASSGCRRGE